MGYRIWFKDNDTPSAIMDTDETYQQMDGEESVLFIEDMDMKPFIDKCLLELKKGTTLRSLSGTICYIQGFYYWAVEGMKATKVNELFVRRSLQVFYNASPEDYAGDKEYIDSKYGELA